MELRELDKMAIKEKVLLFDELLKSDLLTEAECGNDTVSSITWNQYVRRNRQRLNILFGEYKK
jgi:hypothetical protein